MIRNKQLLAISLIVVSCFASCLVGNWLDQHYSFAPIRKERNYIFRHYIRQRFNAVAYNAEKGEMLADSFKKYLSTEFMKDVKENCCKEESSLVVINSKRLKQEVFDALTHKEEHLQYMHGTYWRYRLLCKAIAAVGMGGTLYEYSNDKDALFRIPKMVTWLGFAGIGVVPLLIEKDGDKKIKIHIEQIQSMKKEWQDFFEKN